VGDNQHGSSLLTSPALPLTYPPLSFAPQLPQHRKKFSFAFRMEPVDGNPAETIGAIFEEIPSGTTTLQSLLTQDPSASSRLTFFEALDALDQVLAVCEYLATDKEDEEETGQAMIQWNPTTMLRPENILIFPVPQKTATGKRASRFIVKCLPQKLGGVYPTPESHYIDLIGELTYECLFGHSSTDLEAQALEEKSMPLRPLFQSATVSRNSPTFSALQTFLGRFTNANATNRTQTESFAPAWNKVRDLRFEWQNLLSSAEEDFFPSRMVEQVGHGEPTDQTIAIVDNVRVHGLQLKICRYGKHHVARAKSSCCAVQCTYIEKEITSVH
jgi:hypothetical protein